LPHELATEFNDRRLTDVDRLKLAPAGGIVTFAMTQLAISATQIRKLLANGLSARYLLPDSVLDYIRLHQLYKST
jgi:nicotinate-nucleotide adenylyltransferase